MITVTTETTSPLHHQRARIDLPVEQGTNSGGLAPWQKRRSLELVHRRLRGDLKLATMAQECRLSSSHFARSFKKSFGTTVHQYVLAQRVEAAKVLLSRSTESLTVIALESGFSDQAAFNRTFKALTGTTPGQWRRDTAHSLGALSRLPDHRAA